MALVTVDWNPGPRVLRVFGGSLAASAGLVAAGLWLGADRTEAAAWVGLAGTLLGAVAALGPRGPARAIYVAVSGPAWVVGNVTGRIAVALLFYVLVTPIGLVLRRVRPDPLRLRATSETGWVEVDERETAAEVFERRF